MTHHGITGTAGIALRRATLEDIAAINNMIYRAFRRLMPAHYTAREMKAMAPHARVDPQLVRDGTYFVAEIGGRLAGSGGWSYRAMRKTGGSEARVLDPDTDRAMLRAYFTDSDFARRGIGRALLAASEAEAARAGFREGELIASLSGQPLYESAGWIAAEKLEMSGAGGAPWPAVLMRKRLA